MFIFKRNQIIITALVFMVAIAAYLNFTDNQNAVLPTFEDDAKQMTQKEDLTYTDFLEDYALGEIATLAPDTDSIDGIESDEIIVGEDVVIEDDKGLENDVTADADTEFKEEKVIFSLKDKVVAENQNAQSKTNQKTANHEATVVSKSYDVNYFIEARMDREQRRSEQIEILSECINNSTLDKDSKANAATNLITIQERIEKESGIESLLKAKGFKEVFVRISNDDVDVVINKENIEDAEIAQIEDIVRRKTGYATSQIKISPLKN